MLGPKLPALRTSNDPAALPSPFSLLSLVKGAFLGSIPIPTKDVSKGPSYAHSSALAH